jgi:hypothetical protein
MAEDGPWNDYAPAQPKAVSHPFAKAPWYDTFVAMKSDPTVVAAVGNDDRALGIAAKQVYEQQQAAKNTNRFDEAQARQGDIGLSEPTKDNLGGVVGPIADQLYKGYQATVAGVEGTLKTADDLVDKTGINDRLENPIHPGDAIFSLLEAFPLGGAETGMLPQAAFQHSKISPELQAKYTSEINDLFAKGADRTVLDQYATERGMTKFGPDLDEAIKVRDTKAPEAKPPIGEPAKGYGTSEVRKPTALNDNSTKKLEAEVQRRFEERWPEYEKELDELHNDMRSKAIDTIAERPRSYDDAANSQKHGPVGEVAGRIQEGSEKAREEFEKFLTEKWIPEKRAEIEAEVKGEQPQGGGREPPKPPEEPPSSGGGEPPSPEDTIAKLKTAMQNARNASAQQRGLYSAERSKRIKDAMSASKAVEGEAGYHAQLSALKGEMEKVDFHGVRDEFSQEEVDTLFKHIGDHPTLRGYEEITAKTALAKILDGKVPGHSEVAALSRVFPPDFMKELTKHKTLGEKVASYANATINLPRSLMASYDLSIPGRQGLFLVTRKEWWKAYPEMVKSFGSKKVYEAAQQEIRDRPSFPLMEKSGLAITDMGDNVLNREESFRSHAAQAIPVIGRGVKASERAAVTFSNKLRADLFDNLLRKYKSLGIDLENDLPRLRNVANYINTASGRGKVPFDKVGTLVSDVFFSPQLMKSRFDLLNPGTYVLERDPVLRNQKFRDLAGFGAVATTVLGLLKYNGAKVGTNPLSPDFGKIIDGNVHIDALGGFGQWIRLGAVLALNKRETAAGKEKKLNEGYKPETRVDVAGKFLRSKESPIASIIHDYMAGQDMLGQKPELGKELLTHLVPLSLQDLYEGYTNSGTSSARGVAEAATGMLGAGIQVYDPNQPYKTAPAVINKDTTPTSQEDGPWSDYKEAPSEEEGPWSDIKNGTPPDNVVATSVLESLGAKITDKGVRSHEEQERLYENYSGVAKPGTGAHEDGRALDIKPTRGMTPAKIKEALEAEGFEGVSIVTKRHGSGPHWHVQWENFA